VYDVEFFKAELSWIKDPALRSITKKALEAAPSWFWTAPASSTGKYHPIDSNGDGGLCRHIAKATWLGYKYAECFGLDSDMIVAALLLHDFDKFGPADDMELGADRPHYKRHAAIGATILEQCFPEFSKGIEQVHIDKLSNLWYGVCACIRSHSGKWGEFQPYTLEQKLVHIADISAAHKELVAVRFYDPERATAPVQAEPVQEESKYRFFREEGNDLILNFGKHRGRSVDTVIEQFPSYVEWALDMDFDNASMDEEVKRVFNEAMGITADKPKPATTTGTMPLFEA
jgi:predicted HD phosphohydrolase